MSSKILAPGEILELRRLVQEKDAKLTGSDGRQVAIPLAIHELLLVILDHLQSGNAVSIVPEPQNLTTQRAANMLGVSRPFLVRLLERGDIPFHLVGSHHRVYLHHLLEYKKKRDAGRHNAINDIARSELEAGTYDRVILPEGAEDQ